MEVFRTCYSPGFFVCMQPVPLPGNDLDQNDTIDCCTLPDIDMPYEQACTYAQVQTNFTRSPRMGKSLINLQTCGKNMFNTIAMGTRRSSMHEFSNNLCNTAILGSLNAPKLRSRFDTNVSAQNGEDDNQQPDSAQDSTEKSQPQPNQTPKFQQRPRSESPYNKYIQDLPKKKQLCAKRTPQTKSSQSDAEKVENMEVPKSMVYVLKQQSFVYQLEFRTANVNVIPVYVHPRMAPPTANEKKVQPPNFEYRDQDAKQEPNSSRMFFIRRKYALSSEEQPPSRHTKVVLPPLRVYTDEAPPIRKRSVSESGKTSTNGSVFFIYQGVLLRVRCSALPITQVKLPVDEDILARMEKLGMPTSESRKNKGILVARCGSDLLQFNFTMQDITLNKVELRGTAAVQTEDKMVYIRERSQITGRMLLLPVPESTYFYKDPMETIHRLHLMFQGTNVMPLWKYHLMRQRLAEMRGATHTEAKIEKAFKQTRGSRLVFDGLDAIITAQAGMMCCEVPKGYDLYERIMHDEYQRQVNSRTRAYNYRRNQELAFGTQLPQPKQKKTASDAERGKGKQQSAPYSATEPGSEDASDPVGDDNAEISADQDGEKVEENNANDDSATVDSDLSQWDASM